MNQNDTNDINLQLKHNKKCKINTKDIAINTKDIKIFFKNKRDIYFICFI